MDRKNENANWWHDLSNFDTNEEHLIVNEDEGSSVSSQYYSCDSSEDNIRLKDNFFSHKQSDPTNETHTEDFEYSEEEEVSEEESTLLEEESSSECHLEEEDEEEESDDDEEEEEEEEEEESDEEEGEKEEVEEESLSEMDESTNKFWKDNSELKVDSPTEEETDSAEEQTLYNHHTTAKRYISKYPQQMKPNETKKTCSEEKTCVICFKSFLTTQDLCDHTRFFHYRNKSAVDVDIQSTAKEKKETEKRKICRKEKMSTGTDNITQESLKNMLNEKKSLKESHRENKLLDATERESTYGTIFNSGQYPVTDEDIHMKENCPPPDPNCIKNKQKSLENFQFEDKSLLYTKTHPQKRKLSDNTSSYYEEKIVKDINIRRSETEEKRTVKREKASFEGTVLTEAENFRTFQENYLRNLIYSEKYYMMNQAKSFENFNPERERIWSHAKICSCKEKPVIDTNIQRSVTEEKQTVQRGKTFFEGTYSTKADHFPISHQNNLWSSTDMQEYSLMKQKSFEISHSVDKILASTKSNSQKRKSSDDTLPYSEVEHVQKSETGEKQIVKRKKVCCEDTISTEADNFPISHQNTLRSSTDIQKYSLMKPKKLFEISYSVDKLLASTKSNSPNRKASDDTIYYCENKAVTDMNTQRSVIEEKQVAKRKRTSSEEVISTEAEHFPVASNTDFRGLERISLNQQKSYEDPQFRDNSLEDIKSHAPKRKLSDDTISDFEQKPVTDTNIQTSIPEENHAVKRKTSFEENIWTEAENNLKNLTDEQESILKNQQQPLENSHSEDTLTSNKYTKSDVTERKSSNGTISHSDQKSNNNKKIRKQKIIHLKSLKKSKSHSKKKLIKCTLCGIYRSDGKPINTHLRNHFKKVTTYVTRKKAYQRPLSLRERAELMGWISYVSIKREFSEATIFDSGVISDKDLNSTVREAEIPIFVNPYLWDPLESSPFEKSLVSMCFENQSELRRFKERNNVEELRAEAQSVEEGSVEVIQGSSASGKDPRMEQRDHFVEENGNYC